MTDVASPLTSAPVDGLYTRRSSGLVRAFGIPAAIALAIASAGIGSIFINFGAAFAGFTHLDMTVPTFCGALIWLGILFAYRNLLAAVPRAGGEYVYLSRIVSPVAGALVGISLTVAFLFFLGSDGNLFAAYVPFMLTCIGSAFSSTSISNAASSVTTHAWIAGLSIAVVLVACACVLLPVRRMAKIITWLVIAQIVAVLAAAILLLTHSHADFVAAFGRFSQNRHAYEDLLAATAAAKLPTGFQLGASLAALPFMFLSFNGVLYAYYVGGELRRPGRTYVIASVVTIAFLSFIWVGIWLIMRHTAGLDFIQGQSQLNAADPQKYAALTSLQPSSSGLGYAFVLSADPVTKIIIGLAEPVTLLAACMALVVVATRVLFAQAFDRLLPVTIAAISRQAVPAKAIFVVFLGGVAFAVLNAFGTLTNIVANQSLFTALIVLAGSIAATVLPFRRPELIRAPGATDLRRLAGVPVAAWTGALATALCGLVVGMIVSHPAQFGSFTSVSVGSLVVILAAGPVVYLIARAVRLRRSSIDLKLAMHELPPE